MAVGDEVIFRVVGRCQSQNVVNTMAYEITNQGSSEEDILQVLTDEWIDNNADGWLARHSHDYVLVGVKAFGKTGPTKVPGQTSHGISGSLVDDTLPAMVCRTITLYGDSDNSKRRGRIMISGTVEAHLDGDDGGVTSAEILLMQTLADLLTESLERDDDAFQMRIASSAAGEMIPILAARPRRTPASITSRRIRELLIG